MEIFGNSLKFAFLGTVSATAFTAPVLAQKSTNDALSVEEILVTSRQRSERLQDVPIAVSALSEADIEAAGITRPGDVFALMPGVYYRENTGSVGSSFIQIRGVSQSRNAASPVAIAVDGVLLTNNFVFSNEIFDVEQIEVLKGPQGALYGRSAIGGAINITTKMPEDEFSGIITAGIGRRHARRLDASVSGPIIEDVLLVRGSFYHRGDDGFLRNEFLSDPNPQGNQVFGDDSQDTGARFRALYTPGDKLTLDFRTAYSETEDGGNLTVVADPLIPVALNAPDDNSVPFQPNNDGFSKRDTLDFSLKMDYEAEIGTFTSISSYNDTNESFAADALPYAPTLEEGTQWVVNNFESFSQEFRFTSPSQNRFRYIFGGYYLNQDRLFANSAGQDTGSGVLLIDLDGAIGSVNPATSILADEIDIEAWAGFAQFNFDVTERLEISASFRYDKETQKSINVSPAGLAPDIVRNSPRRNQSFDKFQPKISLTYDVSDDLTLYASYSVGFKPGGFNPSGTRQLFIDATGDTGTVIQDQFGAEDLTSWEIGAKGTYADGRGRFNAAAYYSKLNGTQYFEFIAEATAQINLNIDRQRLFGFELDTTFRLTDEITLMAAASYLDGEVTEQRVSPGAGNGQTSPYMPNFQAAISAMYEKELKENLEGFLRVDYEHVGEIFWDVLNLTRRSPLNFVNLRGGVTFGQERDWRFEAYCKNCTNVDYNVETVVLLANAGGLGVNFPARDTRIWGINMTKRF